MSHDDQERRIAVQSQQRMFRLAERDHGLSRVAIFKETDIPLSTLKSWANDTCIPLPGLRRLMKVIPDELTSLLFAGTGKHIAADDAEEVDFDGLAQEAMNLAAKIAAARSPHSPGGSNIVPIEQAEIGDTARRVCPQARGAAA